MRKAMAPIRRYRWNMESARRQRANALLEGSERWKDTSMGIGLTSGFAEYLAEKIPFESLMGMLRAGRKPAQGVIANILKQAGIEGAEELATEYANVLSDIAIMGEKSEYRTMVHELQHSIQEREGRPVGASPDYWRSRGEADPYGAYRDTAGEIEARQTEERGALTAEERRQKTPDFGWEWAVFAQDDGINYEIKYPHYTREQIEENSKLLHDMDAVSVLTGQEFAKGEVQLKDQVLEFFHRLGNNVHSEQFGDVGLVKSSWRSDLRHGMTNEKAISFAAVPDVIQKGVVIDVYSPGPNTYDRIVVAAPITIAGKDYHMAVMLQRDQQSQRLYLHDVIAKEKQGMQNHTQTGLYANDGNQVSRGSTHLDIFSILRNALNYNNFVKNTQGIQRRAHALFKRKEKPHFTEYPWGPIPQQHSERRLQG